MKKIFALVNMFLFLIVLISAGCSPTSAPTSTTSVVSTGTTSTQIVPVHLNFAKLSYTPGVCTVQLTPSSSFKGTLYYIIDLYASLQSGGGFFILTHQNIAFSSQESKNIVFNLAPLSGLQQLYISAIQTDETYESNTTQSNNNSSILNVVRQLPLIPYGTYSATILGVSESITLNKDGTYSMNDPTFGKAVGTYTISANNITFINAGTNESIVWIYSYSDQFKCLYITQNGQTIPFYHQ